MAKINFQVRTTANTYRVAVASLATGGVHYLEFDKDNSATDMLDNGAYMLTWTFFGEKDSTFQLTATGGQPSPLKYPEGKADTENAPGTFMGHSYGGLIVH